MKFDPVFALKNAPLVLIASILIFGDFLVSLVAQG